MLLPGKTAEEGSHILRLSNEEASKETSYILCPLPTWQSPPLLSAPTDLTSWRHQGAVQVGERNNWGSGDSFRSLIPGAVHGPHRPLLLSRGTVEMQVIPCNYGQDQHNTVGKYFCRNDKISIEILKFWWSTTQDSQWSLTDIHEHSKNQAPCQSIKNNCSSECLTDHTLLISGKF